MHHVSTGFPSCRSRAARIAASSSMMVGLKFWVVGVERPVGLAGFTPGRRLDAIMRENQPGRLITSWLSGTHSSAPPLGCRDYARRAPVILGCGTLPVAEDQDADQLRTGPARTSTTFHP